MDEEGFVPEKWDSDMRETGMDRRERCPGFHIYLPSYEPSGGNEELRVVINYLYQDNRNYNVNIYEDGFTEIRWFRMLGVRDEVVKDVTEASRDNVHRGETLTSAIRKAQSDGMTDATVQSIQLTIVEGFKQLNGWINTMQAVCEMEGDNNGSNSVRRPG